MFGKKKKAATDGSPGSSVGVETRSGLAMVMLRDAVALSPEHLAGWWSHLWPNEPGLSDIEAAVDDTGLASLTCTLPGGLIGVVGVMPFAIPDVDGLSQSTWLWPDFAETGASAAHVVVFVNGASSTAEALTALTRLVAAVNASTGALGVYWGAALHLVRADVFNGMAQEMLADDTHPLHLWVSFQAMAENGRSSLATAGMEQFGLMDLEIMESPREVGELREFAMNIATYLIDNGPVLNDGETVGGSADERYVVRHRPSAVNRPATVYLIEGY